MKRRREVLALVACARSAGMLGASRSASHSHGTPQWTRPLPQFSLPLLQLLNEQSSLSPQFSTQAALPSHWT